LLGKGLRKEALSHLTTFVNHASRWPFPEKKKFISWLYTFTTQQTDTYLLIPHPLYEGFVKPGLLEWAEAEPDNGEPHRWLGAYEHLKEAIRLNPTDEIARNRLAEMVINWIGYSTHELPYGYIGDAEEDLQLLEEVESVIKGSNNEEKRLLYEAEVRELRESISTYLSGVTET
jgi:hypothetical protein